MPDQSATFATEQEVAITIAGNPIASAIVDAYLDIEDTNEITRGGLAFAVAVNAMIGIKFHDDPEAVISGLRWVAAMVNTAASDLEEKQCV